MKEIPILLVLLLILNCSFAQKLKKEIVHLKNGSVLKGHLVKVDDEKVAIQSGKNILVIKESEIDTVSNKWMSAPVAYDQITYFFKTTIGVLAGGSNNSKSAPASFDASFNYNIHSKFYAGAGIGVDLLEESYMPAFLNLEYHFRESRFTPFLGIKSGYMISLDDHVRSNVYYDYSPWSSFAPYYPQETFDNKGGIMFNPSFGFVSRFNQNLGMSLSFGYRFHEVRFEGDNEYELKREYNRLSIRLGIIFN